MLLDVRADDRPKAALEQHAAHEKQQRQCEDDDARNVPASPARERDGVIKRPHHCQRDAGDQQRKTEADEAWPQQRLVVVVLNDAHLEASGRLLFL